MIKENITKRNILVLIIPGVILIFLAIGLIFTRAPWCDEGWIASSAVNLIRNGFMGNTNIIAEGTWLEGINQYTFWQPPLYFIAEATFFKIFNVGLFQIRFLSLLWALISLGAIYYILNKITANKVIIFLSLLVLSVDKNFLEASSGGRMDIMAVSFSLISYAVYLNIRKKNLSLAIFLGNLFICLSGLTHGNGILGFCGLLFIIIFLDRKRITKRDFFIGFLPYLVGGVLWGIYIANDIGSFTSQFFGNYTNETGGLVNLIINEIKIRYFESYSFFPDNPTILDFIKLILKVSVFIFYFINFFIGIFILKEKKDKIPLFIIIIYFLLMALAIRNKTGTYLIWIIPFLIINSMLVFDKLSKKKLLKIFYIIIIAGLIIFSASRSINTIQKNGYNEYISDLTEFNEDYYDGGKIYGSGEITFYYDFDDSIIQDDKYLGYYTGDLPYYIAVEARYKSKFENYEGDIKEYIGNIFKNKYKLIFKGDYYTFYKRINN